jgi:hypothetical protein
MTMAQDGGKGKAVRYRPGMAQRVRVRINLFLPSTIAWFMEPNSIIGLNYEYFNTPSHFQYFLNNFILKETVYSKVMTVTMMAIIRLYIYIYIIC